MPSCGWSCLPAPGICRRCRGLPSSSTFLFTRAAPSDPARSSSLSPCRDFCFGFGSRNVLTIGILEFVEAQKLQGVRPPLRPNVMPCVRFTRVGRHRSRTLFAPFYPTFLSVGCFLRSLSGFSFLTSFQFPVSFPRATLGRDDWLGLFSRGLSPRQECQAFLGALRVFRG